MVENDESGTRGRVSINLDEDILKFIDEWLPSGFDRAAFIRLLVARGIDVWKAGKLVEPPGPSSGGRAEVGKPARSERKQKGGRA